MSQSHITEPAQASSFPPLGITFRAGTTAAFASLAHAHGLPIHIHDSITRVTIDTGHGWAGTDVKTMMACTGIG
eukprot:m.177623 g.177623  ORF g.177623 m.177623 type:complete len:74 (-) comp14385_c0_seq1:81-302(-)